MKRIGCSWLLVIALVAMESAALRAQAPATKTPTAAEDILAKPMPEVNFNATPLGNVIDFLRDVTGANIAVEWKVLEKAGVKKATPVTVRVKDVTVAKALELVLSEAGGGTVKLRYKVDRDVIS